MLPGFGINPDPMIGIMYAANASATINRNCIGSARNAKRGMVRKSPSTRMEANMKIAMYCSI
jgi:hypothetical protein